MSTPPSAWLSNSTYNKLKGSYVNGDIDVSQNIIIRGGNFYVAPNSTLYSTNNSMFFDDVYSYINFNQNIHVFGSLRFDYGAIEYDLGYELLGLLKPQVATNTTDIANNTTDISTLNSSISTINSSITTLTNKTTNLSYSAGTTTFDLSNNASLVLANNSIPSTAINNTSFIALTGTQTGITGVKGFTDNINCSGSIQITSTTTTTGLRLDGVLRLGTGTINAVTISQSTLQKLQYLDVTSNITTSFVPSSGASTIAGIKTFSSAPVMSGASISNSSIPNSALAVTYMDNSTAQTIGGIKTFSSPPVMSGASITNASIPDSALVLGGAYVNLSTAQTIGGIKTFSSPPVMSGASISNSSIPNSALAVTYMDLASTQTISGLKTFSSALTASAGLVCNSITSLSNTALTTANSFITYLNSGKTSGDCRINSSSPNSNTYIDNGILYVGSPTTGTNFIISQPNSTVAGIYSGSLNNASITDYCEGIYLVNGAYGAEFQGGKIGTNTDVCNIGFHNNGTTMNFISAQNTTGTSITNPVVITGQTTIQGSLTLNSYNILNYQPLGTIIQNVSSSIGLPFLLCNGATISRTTYSTLFSLIGTSFGAGDGSTTFNIPNYQGVFLRGMGAQTQNSVVYSAGANPQTFQADALQDHNHNGQSGSYLGTSNVGTSVNGWSPVATLKPQSFSFANTGGVNAGYRSSTETRPANYGIYYYIRVI